MINYSKIKSYYNRIKTNRPIIFISGTFLGIIFTIFSTPILQPIFAQYVDKNLDTEKPEFVSFSPNINERLFKSPEEIKISFKEDGGSGIDKEASKIILKGTTTGDIKEKSIEYFKDLIIFKLNQSLEPDAYTIDIKLADGGGNIAFDVYSFYVLENPEVFSYLKKYGPNVTKIWMNQTNESNYLVEYYGLVIHNTNKTFLKNIIFETKFPGIIQNYSIIENDGISDLHLKIGESIMSLELEISNVSSCYTKINIGSIAPDGILSITFKIDLNFSNYGYIAWCGEGIGDPFVKCSLEDEYIINYDYQEYGFWFHKTITDNIGSMDIHQN